ncbi:MAG: hypothetical protein RR548_09425 [Carnobacterium sp.]|uniref:hypothetical protein n=1 Tax=Carnobacterium sp. TaxID=48221 RepID=UPI002FC88AAF
MKQEKSTRRPKWDIIGQDNAEAGFNISWASVIAGVVTFLALLITFSLVGSAIGFGQVEATSNNPLDGVGTGLLIWTVVAFVLSLCAAGFIAGVTSRRMGTIHGFLTWATSVIVFVLMLSYVTSGIFSVAGTALGNIFSVAGKSVETVASGAGDLISKSFDQVVGSVGEVDSKELEGQVQEILKDTDVPELQPNYINNQLKEASSEITEAGEEIALNPDNADQIIKQTTGSLQKRAEALTDAADKEAIAEAVSKNTDLTQAEADEATDNIYNGLQEASTQAQQKLDEASKQIEKAQQELDKQIEEARIKADEAADATAKASMWGFVALILGMILTSVAGLLGSNFVTDRNEERM